MASAHMSSISPLASFSDEAPRRSCKSSSRERPKRLHRLSNLGFRASLKLSMEHSLFAATFQSVPPRQHQSQPRQMFPLKGIERGRVSIGRACQLYYYQVERSDRTRRRKCFDRCCGAFNDSFREAISGMVSTPCQMWYCRAYFTTHLWI